MLPAPARPLLKEPNAEPIPGYRLLEPLGQGGFGEVWKCEAPGGLHKAIKFVYGSDGLLGNGLNGAEQELRALQHVKSIRHPFLLSMDRVERLGGELVIVMELADCSLHDVLVEHRKAGRPGIPRDDLLMHLFEAAEVLDLMNQEHGLQHLDVKPRNLFLVHRHVKVADFGLVNSLAELCGQDQARFQLGAITPLYSAPETFLGKITLFSDQYSLAIVYCELLTGQLPFHGKNFRMLALQHTSGKPDLALLPEADQPIVARALAKDPRQRYSSCMDFIRTLMDRPESGLPSSAGPETKREPVAVSTATKHDLPVVEERTACTPRPTMALRRPTPTFAAVALENESATLDGFQFLDCLGRNPLGELWTVETPEGQRRLVKLVNTFSQGRSEETMREASVAAQLRAMRHRSLLPADIIPHTANRLALVTAGGRENLGSRLQECQSGGQAGIPRLELLNYLLQAGRALDELQALYGLQHLGLSPRCLMLVDGELQIADFGLMALVWLPAGQQAAQINPRYSAPELFARRFSRSCDQYSLALIYYELLTGDQVHGNRTPAQLAKVRAAGMDSFDLLPAPDRPIMARALHPEPAKRFPSCAEFVRALLDITPGGDELLEDAVVELGNPEAESAIIPIETVVPVTKAARFEPSPHAGRVIAGLVKQLAGDRELREQHGVPFFYRDGIEIEHRCYARLVPGTLRLKLGGFVEQWRLQLLEEGTDRFLLQMRLQTSMWRRLLAQHPGLDIDIQALVPAVSGSMTEVVQLIRPTECGGDEATAALLKWGPALIESLRVALQVGPERRKQPRLPFERPVTARPLLAAGRLGDEIHGQAKDLSLEGLGLYLPIEPPSELIIQLPRGDEEPIEVPAQVMRVQRLDNGNHEVGLRFLLRN